MKVNGLPNFKKEDSFLKHYKHKSKNTSDDKKIIEN